jgi:hypothetical protein
MVERFNPSLMGTREDWADCVPCEDGDFVRYSDYAILSAKLAEAERERDDLAQRAAVIDEALTNAVHMRGVAEACVAELEKAISAALAIHHADDADDPRVEMVCVLDAALATKGPKP